MFLKLVLGTCGNVEIEDHYNTLSWLSLFENIDLYGFLYFPCVYFSQFVDTSTLYDASLVRV